MRKFTSTEIDLCEKIAEKDFKEITYGDYYSHGDGAWHLCDGRKLKKALDEIGVIPLWQEHDCLEWLITKGMNCGVFYDHEDEIWRSYLTIIDQDIVDTLGNTPLESLLRAVLAVMEGK